jgi:hypothetical protein
VDPSREDAAVALVPRAADGPAALADADTDTEEPAEAGAAASGGSPQTLQ